MSGDHNQYQKDKSYLDDFECPRCGHCCKALEIEQDYDYAIDLLIIAKTAMLHAGWSNTDCKILQDIEEFLE